MQVCANCILTRLCCSQTVHEVVPVSRNKHIFKNHHTTIVKTMPKVRTAKLIGYFLSQAVSKKIRIVCAIPLPVFSKYSQEVTMLLSVAELSVLQY